MDFINFWKEKKLKEKFIVFIGVVLAVFQIYTALFGSFDALFQRIIHLGLSLLLVFFLFPAKKGKVLKAEKILNVLFIFCIIVSLCYLIYNYEWITVERFSLVTPVSSSEFILGFIFILLCLESVRRVVGIPLFIVTLIFLIYPLIGYYCPAIFHTRSMHWNELIDFNYLSSGGIFGIPLGVSATEIAVFIIFGSIMLHTGGSELINSIALSLAGKTIGGPAKVAVVASSLFGTISGSGVANVATTGCITIPMMKRAGYRPHFAGAVEAVASTGGQIMPPIMGAAAFVMSAFSGVPYSKIIIHAILPAILYYIALFSYVHLEARKLNLQPGVADLTFKESIKLYGHMILPIIVLIFFLIVGYTPRFSAGLGIVTALIVCQFKEATRLSLKKIFEALYDGARGMLIVVTSCAAAGIIVGSIDMTGLGPRFGNIFLYISGGNLQIALLVAAITGIILGMGLPTTPAYIVQVATIIPALIAMGLNPLVAHFFAFYYSCLSLITPPVAAAAYTAASIAEADGWKTGWTAFRLGFVSYLIPFIFAYKPTLLFIGSWWEIIIDFVTAFIGVYFIAVSFEGFMFYRIKVIIRLIALVVGIFLLLPSLLFSSIGAVLGAFLVLFVYLKRGENLKKATVN